MTQVFNRAGKIFSVPLATMEPLQKKSVAKLEPGLKTWSPKQNTNANNCKTVQKQKHENRYT